MSKAKNTTRPRSTSKTIQRSSDPIVSCSELVTGDGTINECEFGLVMAHNAFQRWMTRCMAAAGASDLNALDILVLHQVHHRKRQKRLSDICFVLNIEDSHTVSYALKKLVQKELVGSHRRGKETLFSISVRGQQLCHRYREVRELCLLGPSEFGQQNSADLTAIATQLRALSGWYDQAARSAASL